MTADKVDKRKGGKLEKLLHLLRNGDITFDAMVMATRAEWERLAGHLARRWIPPAWFTAEDDLVQELLLGVWRWVWQWDPDRGPSLTRYVIFNAMTDAKTKLHAARGALLSGSRDRNPSRIERPFSSMSSGRDADPDADQRFVEQLLRIEPEAEHVMVAAAEREEANEVAVAQCATLRERAVIFAIAEVGTIETGTLDDAAAMLFADRGMRVAFGLRTNDDAVDMVVDAALAVSQRL